MNKKARAFAAAIAVLAVVFSAASCSRDVTPKASPQASEQQSPSTQAGEPGKSGSAGPGGGPAEPEEAQAEQSPPEEERLTSDAEFSFEIGGATLTLRELGVDPKLRELPLSLVSDETEVLGETSDTFKGSYLRTVKFDGLEILLFAPEDSPNSFWIMQMTSTSPAAATHRGIRVGDDIKTLLEKYPEAERLDSDDAERYIYTKAGSDCDELSFEVSGGKVAAIALTFYMP